MKIPRRQVSKWWYEAKYSITNMVNCFVAGVSVMATLINFRDKQYILVVMDVLLLVLMIWCIIKRPAIERSTAEDSKTALSRQK